MLYIFSNSDDKSIHHIVCTDSDIRAGVIISRIYEREHISGEPVRVIFHNETSVQGCVYGTPKRYEAIKATDKSNDTFEEEVAAKVAALGKGEYKINLSKSEPVNTQYNEFINDIIARYRDDTRPFTLWYFITHCIDTRGYDAEQLFKDVDAEVDRRIANDLNELDKVDDVLVATTKSKTVKPDVAAVIPYDNPEEFIYKANINELVARYYKYELNANRLDVIIEVARNNSYDVDKFVKDVSDAHKAAYTAYIAKTNKSNSANYEK